MSAGHVSGHKTDNNDERLEGLAEASFVTSVMSAGHVSGHKTDNNDDDH